MGNKKFLERSYPWIAYVSFAIILSVLSACGNSTQGGPENPAGPGTPTVSRLNGSEYKAIDKGTLESTDTSVKGSGSIVFKDPRAEEDSNYTLAFTLEDKGALTLASNSDNRLASAVKLTLARQGTKLKVTLGSDDLSEEFESVQADGPLNFSIDVHGHGHIMVWIGAGEKQEYSFTGRYPGRLWGLILSNATVTAAKADKAKDVH